MFLVNSMKESGLLEGMCCSFPLQGESFDARSPDPRGFRHFVKMMCFFVFHKMGYVRFLEGVIIYRYYRYIIFIRKQPRVMDGKMQRWS